MAAQPTSEVTDAKEPFHSSAKADIILRSSESVDFFVLKGFLSFASPVFHDMMSLNQGNPAEENDTRKGLHVVQLPEDRKTLYNLLLLIYPFTEKPRGSLGTLLNVARAARKYGMDKAEEKLRKQMETSEVLTTKPTRTFVVAMHLGWREEVRTAALTTLMMPLKDLVQHEELKLISAAVYQGLLQWRFECLRAVTRFLKSDNEKNHRSERKFLVEALLDRLKVTDCPHSSVIMDDRTVAKVFKNVVGHEIEGGKTDPWNISSYIDQAHEALMKICNTVATQIDDVVLKVRTCSQSTSTTFIQVRRSGSF
ncbi:hypothetical protein APHAL10511_005278 [Amanita phalloides]|nr:hypothetical protein APHAL10511_005278 [Amanita phalloides]